MTTLLLLYYAAMGIILAPLFLWWLMDFLIGGFCMPMTRQDGQRR